MKKILLIVFIMFFLTLNVEAKTLKVISLKSFSTEFPATTFEVQTIQKENIRDVILEQGTIISGIVLKVEPPKIGKRNSCFEFIPIEITYRGITKKIKHPTGIAKVLGYNPTTPKERTFSIARKAANLFLRGAISVIEFTHGAVKAQNGHRIKSGVMEAYDDSFLSYIERGKELHINKGDILILKIKTIR